MILAHGEVAELENIHVDPEKHFAMPYERVAAPDVIATWHTHPTTGPNLSRDDYHAFVAFPGLKHYIISANAVWCFYMRDDILLVDHNPAEVSP